MKKRTLNQIWIFCLRMWRSVSKAKAKNKRRWISVLKRQWLTDNGFKNLSGNCFFCDETPEDSCALCPGRLVDPTFNCCRADYHYKHKPSAFYAELLRLNRIRKGKE